MVTAINSCLNEPKYCIGRKNWLHFECSSIFSCVFLCTVLSTGSVFHTEIIFFPEADVHFLKHTVPSVHSVEYDAGSRCGEVRFSLVSRPYSWGGAEPESGREQRQPEIYVSLSLIVFSQQQRLRIPLGRILSPGPGAPRGHSQ